MRFILQTKKIVSLSIYQLHRGIYHSIKSSSRTHQSMHLRGPVVMLDAGANWPVRTHYGVDFYMMCIIMCFVYESMHPINIIDIVWQTNFLFSFSLLHIEPHISE